MKNNNPRITPGQVKQLGLHFPPVLVTGEGSIGIPNEEFRTLNHDLQSIPLEEISGSPQFPHGNGD